MYDRSGSIALLTGATPAESRRLAVRTAPFAKVVREISRPASGVDAGLDQIPRGAEAFSNASSLFPSANPWITPSPQHISRRQGTFGSGHGTFSSRSMPFPEEIRRISRRERAFTSVSEPIPARPRELTTRGGRFASAKQGFSVRRPRETAADAVATSGRRSVTRRFAGFPVRQTSATRQKTAFHGARNGPHAQ